MADTYWCKHEDAPDENEKFKISVNTVNFPDDCNITYAERGDIIGEINDAISKLLEEYGHQLWVDVNVRELTTEEVAAYQDTAVVEKMFTNVEV